MNNVEIENYNIDDVLNALRVVFNEMSGEASNIERYCNGIISNVSSDGVNADVSVNGKTLNGLKNKTSETLSVGDSVRVYYTRKTMSDAYIGLKLN